MSETLRMQEPVSSLHTTEKSHNIFWMCKNCIQKWKCFLEDASESCCRPWSIWLTTSKAKQMHHLALECKANMGVRPQSAFIKWKWVFAEILTGKSISIQPQVWQTVIVVTNSHAKGTAAFFPFRVLWTIWLKQEFPSGSLNWGLKMQTQPKGRSVTGRPGR